VPTFVTSVNFLFWNLFGNSKSQALREAAVRASLGRLVSCYDVDVFLFAECAIPRADLIATLDGAGGGKYQWIQSTSNRVVYFSRLPNARWVQRLQNSSRDRHVIQSLQVGNSKEILLVGVHGKSRLEVPSEGGRAELAGDIVRSIRTVEDHAVGHRRTVVVGDFNMNPFEQGMVGARAMHAVISRNLAQTVHEMGSRAVDPCFYNPMWAFFGDWPVANRPPGTYFFANTSDPCNHFWNVFDQVIVRPEIMGQLIRLEILDTDGQESLVTSGGRPKKAMLADHLPLLFTLSL
jgi:hypothetical protein